MSKYIGVKCPVCSKKFSSSDDIVVCPTCGAPHHRHCYMEKGECVFAAEHLSGKEWHAPQDTPPPPDQQEASNCPGCGANNPSDSLCQVCGTRLSQGAGPEGQQQGGVAPGFPSWPFPGHSASSGYGTTGGMFFGSEAFRYGGVSPDSTIAGEPTRDIATYVGSNTIYYIPRFKLFSDGASALSVNLSAMVFSFFYFFYRKMYVIGSILLAISALSMIPYFLYLREMLPQLMTEPSSLPLLQLLEELGTPFTLTIADINYDTAAFYENIYRNLWIVKLVLRFVVAAFANYLYYRKATKSVGTIRESMNAGGTVEPARYTAMLIRKGGVSNMAAVTGAVASVVIYLFIGSYLFSGVL